MLGPTLTTAAVPGIHCRTFMEQLPGVESKLAAALQITKSLASIHATGIVYCNISPEHVWIDPSKGFQAIWTDFDKSTRLSRLKQTISHPLELNGELAYFSPELTGRINRVVDWRSDLYGLGVLLYELFAGKLPFDATTPMEWVNAHLAEPPAPLAEGAAPNHLEKLLLKLLNKNPEQRYASIQGVIYDLERIIAGEANFELGAKDFSQTFALPDKLYGRDAELAVLEQTLAAIHGPLQFVAIAAPSGMGKTALVEELKRSMSLKGAMLCSGKFDQYAQAEPFGALAHAIDDLARQVLGLDTSSYESWRKRVLKSLNGYGRLLTDLSPMMERLLGEQPPLPEVDADRAARRIADTFLGFFKHCASTDRPVIMFIDDLQWVDSATFGVLDMLKSQSSNIQNLLMIHAYRSNELVAGSPYAKWLDEVNITLIEPQPLPEHAVYELLSDGFHQRISQDHLKALSHLIEGRSGGSPFYVRELIANLIDQEAICLDSDQAVWKFDATIAAKIEFSADVAELLLAKIKLLPPETIEALSLMSFVGREFSLDQIVKCTDASTQQEAARILWPAIELDLIAPLHEGMQLLLVSDDDVGTYQCRFVHDKVQAASQASIADADRQKIKEHIAFRLLGDLNPQDLGREAIVLAELLNEAELFGDEAIKLRRLQLRSGLLARSSGQIKRAKEFLIKAFRFVDAWLPQHEADTIAIVVELSEVHRANADLDSLVSLDQEIHQNISDKVKASPVVIALIQTYCANQKMRESIDRSLLFCRSLGYPVRMSKNPGLLLLSYARARLALGDPQKSLQQLKHADERAGAIQSAILAAGTALIGHEAECFPLIVCDLVNFAVKEGTSVGGISGLAVYGIVAKVLGHHKFAQNYLAAINAASERFGSKAPSMVHMVCNVLATPTFKTVLTPEWIARFYQKAETLIRHGDVELSAGILNGLRIIAINSGQSLSTFRELFRETYAEFHLPGKNYIERYHEFYQHALDFAASTELRDLEFPPLAADADVASTVDYWNTVAAWKILLGQRISVKDHQARRRIEDSVAGQPSLERMQGFYEIYCARFGPIRLPTLKERLIDGVKRWMGWSAIKKLHALGYEPFVPIAELVWGTRAEKRGRRDQAMQHYKKAYDAAERSGSLREQIFAAEYAFRLVRERSDIGSMVWLKRALDAAEAYGLNPKLTALKTEFAADISALYELFPELKKSSRQGNSSEDLDLATLIQAGASLAEAKDLSSLIKISLEIVVQNLSASHGELWQKSDDGWQLLSEPNHAKSTDASKSNERDAHLLDEVFRAGEIRVIDDASDSGLGCQSAIFLPLASGGQSIALMLIENESLTDAFPRERLPFLRTLSSQIATAIANALLYAQMEEKVQEKARAMVAIMTHIEQGILTIEARGKIAEDYSQVLPKILGVKQIAGRDPIEILFGQAELAEDQIDQVEATLSSCLGEDVLNFEVNSERFVREMRLRSGKIIELDWVPITDDFEIVKSVMTTLRDVTEVRASQAAAEASAMELKRIGSLLALSPRQSLDFMADARTRLASCHERLSKSSDPKSWLELNFRDLHTLKGVSRSYQFLDLAALIHEVEEPYQSARQESPDRLPQVSDLQKSLEDLMALVAEYQRVETEILKRQGEAGLDLAALRQAVSRREWQKVESLLAEAAEDRLDLASLLAPVVKSLPALAQELGRPEPIVRFDLAAQSLDPSIGTILLGAMTHVLRNSVDHGLKTAADDGGIVVATSDVDGFVHISVEDAGRGLNLLALEQKLGHGSDEDLAEAIFQSGLSTNESVSAISGRGVGMDAVRAAIEELGGRVYVEFRKSDRDAGGYRKHRLVILVPRRQDTSEAKGMASSQEVA